MSKEAVAERGRAGKAGGCCCCCSLAEGSCALAAAAVEAREREREGVRASQPPAMTAPWSSSSLSSSRQTHARGQCLRRSVRGVTLHDKRLRDRAERRRLGQPASTSSTEQHRQGWPSALSAASGPCTTLSRRSTRSTISSSAPASSCVHLSISQLSLES